MAITKYFMNRIITESTDGLPVMSWDSHFYSYPEADH